MSVSNEGQTIKENYVFEKWEELPLKEELLRGIYASGYNSPSFIQKSSVRPLIEGVDIRAQAQSGTGKTGAFCVGAIQRVCGDTTQVLVLASTREIASQNYRCLKDLSRFMDIGIQLLLGGTSVKDDIEGLANGPQIVVGTPGRVLHMIERGYMKCNDISLLIIDEADEMLKLGFQEQVKSIFCKLNTEKVQVAMFSATWERAELEVSSKILRHGHHVIDLRLEEQTLKGINQYYVNLGPRQAIRDLNEEIKIQVLIDIYSKSEIGQSIIFVNSVERVKAVHAKLIALGFSCGVIHSNLSQEGRDQAMSKFQKGECRTLIASNLVGRGVDVQQLSVVINFDIPTDSFATYIHRIGRAGRYGRKGTAINFIFEDEKPYLEDIERHYRTVIQPLPLNFNCK
eukprot:jgi/Antlo1/1522/2313